MGENTEKIVTITDKSITIDLSAITDNRKLMINLSPNVRYLINQVMQNCNTSDHDIDILYIKIDKSKSLLYKILEKHSLTFLAGFF